MEQEMNYWDLTLPEQLVWAAAFARSMSTADVCPASDVAAALADKAVEELRRVRPRPGAPKQAEERMHFGCGLPALYAGPFSFGDPSWWRQDQSLDKFCHCGHERHEGVCGKPMYNGPPPTAPCDCHEFKPVPRVPMATGWYYGRDCRPKDKY